jgi:hypothetical protein
LFLCGLVGVWVKPSAGSLIGYSSSLLEKRRRRESTAIDRKSLPFDRSLGFPSCSSIAPTQGTSSACAQHKVLIAPCGAPRQMQCATAKDVQRCGAVRCGARLRQRSQCGRQICGRRAHTARGAGRIAPRTWTCASWMRRLRGARGRRLLASPRAKRRQQTHGDEAIHVAGL